MPKFRNSDYETHKWKSPSKPLTPEGFLLFILSEVGNSSDFRSNILGALSVLAHEETWDYDSEISSAYAGLEIFMVDFCEKVRECILNNQQVKDAIITTILEQGYYPSQTVVPLNQGQAIDNIIDGLPCTEDDLKGYAKEIVEYVNNVALDAIQIFASETQQSMFFARFLDYFPLLGDLPIIDDISDIASWIENVLIVQYLGGYTESLRDEIICAIYSKSCFDCELTALDIVNAYASLAGFSFPNGADIGVILDLLKGTMSDRLVVLTFHALVVAAMGSGSKVLGYVGVKGLKQIVANASPFELEGCDPCSIPSQNLVTFDAGGYPTYTYSVYSTSGHGVSGGVSAIGNGGNALGGTRPLQQFLANLSIEVVIDLMSDKTVTGVTYDVWSTTNPLSSGLSSYGAILNVTDSLDNVLYTTQYVRSPVSPETWIPDNFGALSVVGARKVKLTIFQTSSNAVARSAQLRLDNILVSLEV